MKYKINNESILWIDKNIYGGDQGNFLALYENKYLQMRGCGIVALANSFYYLSKTRSNYRNLYPFNCVNENIFAKYSLLISDFLKPSIAGIPLVSYLSYFAKKYAKSRGLEINKKSISFVNSKKRILEFIIHGLKKDSLVLSVHWNHKSFLLRQHWVAITGLDLNKNKIFISSWGERYSMDIDEFCSFTLYRGLIYFY